MSINYLISNRRHRKWWIHSIAVFACVGRRKLVLCKQKIIFFSEIVLSASDSPWRTLFCLPGEKLYCKCDTCRPFHQNESDDGSCNCPSDGILSHKIHIPMVCIRCESSCACSGSNFCWTLCHKFGICAASHLCGWSYVCTGWRLV